MRIREVVKETGVSRELIHHYLRQGLLPQPERRGLYSERQVLLLRLLRKLREDHHLPLEVIRSVFEIFHFDPDRLEPFTLADSLNNRLTNLTNGGDIFSATLTSVEIVKQVGISPDRLKEYMEAKLVRPAKQDDGDRYSVYDLNIIALCERGTHLGIPFHSLRNICAYVRVAFELEHKFLFETAPRAPHEPKKVLGEIFIRQEIITRFIQNLVQSLICHRLSDLVTLGSETGGTLDGILFRPSPVFLKKHGLDRAIEVVQENLCRSPEETDLWRQAARLMLHAGRLREAIFFLEQALVKWPEDPSLLALQGRALILSGQHERGVDVLKKQDCSGRPDPLSPLWQALCLLVRPQEGTGYEPPVSQALDLMDLIEQALGALRDAAWDVRSEVRMIAGWILSSIPSPLRQLEQGADLLIETYHSLQEDICETPRVPGLRERYLINTAYLLFRSASGKDDPTGGRRAGSGKEAPSTEELRSTICRLDPASSFAEKVFLARNDHAETGDEA